MFKDALDTPEAATRKNRDSPRSGLSGDNARHRNDRGLFGGMGFADEGLRRSLINRQRRLYTGPDHTKTGETDAKHDCSGEEWAHRN